MNGFIAEWVPQRNIFQVRSLSSTVNRFQNLKIGDVILGINSISLNTLNKSSGILLLTRVIHSLHFQPLQNYKNFENTSISWSSYCQYGCGYIHLNKSVNERKKCCMQGAVDWVATCFPKLYCVTPVISKILQNNTDKFSKSSTTYNNVLAFAATGVDNERGGGWEKDMLGPHAVKLNGRTYHFLMGATNSTDPSCGLSYFVFDTRSALAAHGDKFNRGSEIDLIDNNLLLNIYNDLCEYNPIARECKQIGNLTENINDNTTPRLISNLKNVVSYFEIAHITSETANQNRVLRMHLKDSNNTTTIPITHEYMEPLCYPIFFTKGEPGWGENTRARIPFLSYLSHRLLSPEYNDDGTPFTCQSLSDPNRRIHCNRFQAAARLGQVYLVDMVSRAIDYRLRWNAVNQKTIFGISENNELSTNHIGELEDEEELNDHNKSFLSSKFHGSRRHLKKLATNALTVVSEMGVPDLFITLTCNPYWEEITSRLFVGQTAFDRQDVVCQVFKQKLDIILKNIKNGKYFQTIEVNYMMRVIEYQHRGLPHAHIVVQFKNLPKGIDNPEEAIVWIDNNISALMPPNITSDTHEEDKRFRSLVEIHMIHKCSCAINGCKKNEACKCKRGYDDTCVTLNTTFNNQGFPNYKRLKMADFKVVPHNKLLLLDWNGHANVEYAGSSTCVLYLYKYLYKGPKKVKVTIDNDFDDKSKDEIGLYLSGRFLCSMDAMWRVLGYQTYPASIPPVQTIQVNLIKSYLKRLFRL